VYQNPEETEFLIDVSTSSVVTNRSSNDYENISEIMLYLGSKTNGKPRERESVSMYASSAAPPVAYAKSISVSSESNYPSNVRPVPHVDRYPISGDVFGKRVPAHHSFRFGISKETLRKEQGNILSFLCMLDLYSLITGRPNMLTVSSIPRLWLGHKSHISKFVRGNVDLTLSSLKDKSNSRTTHSLGLGRLSHLEKKVSHRDPELNAEIYIRSVDFSPCDLLKASLTFDEQTSSLASTVARKLHLDVTNSLQIENPTLTLVIPHDSHLTSMKMIRQDTGESVVRTGYLTAPDEPPSYANYNQFHIALKTNQSSLRISLELTVESIN
jgi:hypothetical protein